MPIDTVGVGANQLQVTVMGGVKGARPTSCEPKVVGRTANGRLDHTRLGEGGSDRVGLSYSEQFVNDFELLFTPLDG
jgi:hypothetical protein